VTLPKPNLHIFVIFLAREQLALMKSPEKYSNSEAGQHEKCTIQTNCAVFFVSRLLVTFVGKNEKFSKKLLGTRENVQSWKTFFGLGEVFGRRGISQKCKKCISLPFRYLFKEQICFVSISFSNLP